METQSLQKYISVLSLVGVLLRVLDSVAQSLTRHGEASIATLFPLIFQLTKASVLRVAQSLDNGWRHDAGQYYISDLAHHGCPCYGDRSWQLSRR